MLQEELLSRVVALHAATATVLLAIDGRGGSGKTLLAKSIANGLAAASTPVSIVHVDDFFLPSGQRPHGSPGEKPIGGDFDWVRLRDQVLAPLRRGESARYDRYDWDRDALWGTLDVPAGQVVIVEGIYASRRELADLYELRVWVECPRELRLARGLARDGEGARLRWVEDWMPSEDRYVREHRPMEYANVIVSGAAA